MKTITEFPTMYLKSAIQSEEALKVSGKTTEELPTALGESLKLEGDKLKYLLQALTIYRARGNGLKRIIVINAAEGEKLPPGVEKVEEVAYLPEFYPSAASAQPQRGRDGDGRGGRGDRGGRGGDRNKGGKRGESDRGGRRSAAPGFAPAQAPRPVVLNADGTPRVSKIITDGPATAAGPRPARGARPPRAPREPRAPGSTAARPPRAPRAPREAKPAANALDQTRAPRALRVIPRSEVAARAPAAAATSVPAEASASSAE